MTLTRKDKTRLYVCLGTAIVILVVVPYPEDQPLTVLSEAVIGPLVSRCAFYTAAVLVLSPFVLFAVVGGHFLDRFADPYIDRLRKRLLARHTGRQ